MKKALIPILIVVLLCSIISIAADDVEITYKAINNSVKPGEWAKFDITIRNNKIADDSFLVKIPEEGIEWSSLAQPPTMLGNYFPILGNHIKTFRLLLKDKDLPRISKFPKTVTLQVYSERDKANYITMLPVYLVSGEAYVETKTDLSVGLNIPKFIDPRNSYSLKLMINNNNAKQYENLKVKIESSLFERDATIDLDGNSTNAVDFTVNFNNDQEPMKDTISFKVYEEDTLIYQGSTDYEVVSYRMAFKQDSVYTTKFFKTTEEIKLTNEENSESTKDVMIPVGFWKRLVTSTDPDAEVQDIDGQKHLVWTVTLDSGDSTSVTLVTNNRIYLFIIILLALGIFLYIMFRDPVVITKNAERIKMIQGGIVEMKIMLLVKNRSKKNLDHSEIIERIPHLIKYEERHEHGSLPPDSKVANQKGTVLKWNLDLDAKEERIITYHLKTSLNILGGINLPPALVRLKVKKGHVTIKSNPVRIATSEEPVKAPEKEQ